MTVRELNLKKILNIINNFLHREREREGEGEKKKKKRDEKTK